MSRYIPNTQEDMEQMLSEIGLSSVDQLFTDIPEGMKLSRALDLPGSLSEMELSGLMRGLAKKNAHCGEYACFLGAGAYDHFVPAMVKQVLSKPEIYTSYTPYQPEISQGMLQAIFEYQTMICQLTGMDVSNASMYDGATAVTEAALIAVRSTGKSRLLVSQGLHPEYREVLKTYGKYNDLVIEEIPLRDGITAVSELDVMSGVKGSDGANAANTTLGDENAGKATTGKSDIAAVIVQSPNFLGAVEDLKWFGEFAASKGALSIACVDPISIALLEPPGACGIDIAAGEGQGLGNALNYGGPYLGFLAAKKAFVRKMPGRIVGQTTDNEDKRGFVLTLQAREQHIRREKAVSNICSNQALNALAAAVYMSVMGKEGIKEAANLCLQKAHYAAEKLFATGKFAKLSEAAFIKEFAVRALHEPIQAINERLLRHGIIGGLDLEKYYPKMKDCWLLAVTEKRTKQEIDDMVRIAAGGES